MKAVVLPIPAHWSQIEPPKSKYRVAENLVLDVSAIQAMPEDPHEWLRVELVRRGGESVDPIRVTATTGWPMLLVEGAHGDQRVLIAMYQLLELAAVATLIGPAAAFAAHADEVKLVLMQATVHWGDPPLTIAALLSGVPTPKPQ